MGKKKKKKIASKFEMLKKKMSVFMICRDLHHISAPSQFFPQSEM